MPFVDVDLNEWDLDLLGTKKPSEVEAVLSLLSEVALGDVMEKAVLPIVDGLSQKGPGYESQAGRG